MTSQRQGQGESTTSVRLLKAAEKQRQALELRKAGASFEAIAQKLGYTERGAAYRAVMSGLKKTLQEPAEALRKLELERCDRLLLAVWDAARQGNQGAIDRALRIMERRARYLGLDAPTKHEVTMQTITDVTKELADLEKRQRQEEAMLGPGTRTGQALP